MSDIFGQLKVNTNTFEDYKKWLFNHVNKDKEKYLKIGKASDTVKIKTLTKYLEYKQTPLLSALCYYSYKHDGNYDSLLVFTIRAEFKRLEQKKIIDYVPF